jgi:molecular chaperone HscA
MSDKRSWLDIIRGKKAPAAPPTPSPAPDAAPVALDLSLLNTPPDNNWLACIDFGTAFSKMCIVQRHAAGATKPDHVRPLRVGPQIKTESRSFFAPSTLYILKDRIYFGDRALRVSSDHNDADRECFQSPKQVLSEMEDGALDVPPAARQDPTQSFTRGELMALLLAHLIWQGHTAAQKERLNGLPRLRFARPAWRPDRVQRGEAQLLKLFGRAFAIAGTLRERLVEPDGVPTKDAKSVLALLHDDDGLRDLVMKRVEIGEDQRDSIDRGFVPEATAVAAAAIHPEKSWRRVFIVVDVGAGTTDFGAFVTVPGKGDGRIGELRRGQRVILRAGNFLDEQVVAFLREKAGLTDGLAGSISSLAYLKREAPRIKQDLFRKGLFTEELPNGELVRANLDELLALPSLQRFADDLWERFSETLSEAVEFTRNLEPPPAWIEVILTGGGSQLPMVRELVSRAQSDPPVKLIDAAPQWTKRTSWSTAFPQLAVAVGGAMPVMPEQR